MRDEIWLRDALIDIENQMRENNIEGFKTVAKGLVKDAMKTLEDAQNAYRHKHNPQILKEKFNLLRHYLDYLKRICEGLI